MTCFRIAPSARAIIAATLLASLPSAAIAGETEEDDPAALSEEKKPAPVTDDTVTVVDVITTPVQDLNLARDEIPELLLEIQKDPYNLDGIQRCSHYIAAISDLDDLLGPDFDIAGPQERQLSVGGVAQSALGTLIPFRGLIREISGANKHQQEFQDAIVAGLMRRAYLKGAGQKLGCNYPARPADEATRAMIAAQVEAEQAEEDRKKAREQESSTS